MSNNNNSSKVSNYHSQKEFIEKVVAQGKNDDFFDDIMTIKHIVDHRTKQMDINGKDADKCLVMLSGDLESGASSLSVVGTQDTLVQSIAGHILLEPRLIELLELSVGFAKHLQQKGITREEIK